MAWSTPTLKELRALVRDKVAAGLGAVALVPNSVARVLADSKAGLAHLVLLYIDWLAKQLMPDTAETEWLDRHGQIWLRNADGSKGRKAATFARGSVTVTGIEGRILPSATPYIGSSGVSYETTEDVTLGTAATAVSVVATVAGVAGNLDAGEKLQMTVAVDGVDGTATVVALADGADEENDDYLRERVLFRIQQPPMGGDADDYVRWALEVPGVTRAWCAPNEMGIGTVTVRFMMDDLRGSDDPFADGFPLAEDIAAVQAHLDQKRPVTVKDFYVQSPIPEPIDFAIANLVADDSATRAAIAASVAAMLKDRARPAYALMGVKQGAQTIYREWVSAAITAASGVEHFDLTMTDHVMPNNGCMAVRGTISYA